MILLLIHFLSSKGFDIPTVFSYTSTRMMLAALTSLILSLFIGPFFIRKLYELKIGQTIRTEECPLLGELHRDKKNTPTMGGILVLSCMVTSLFLWMDFTSIFTWMLLATTLVMGGLGAYDDYLKLKYKNAKGLSARRKLFIQVSFGLLIACYLIFVSNDPSDSLFRSPTVKEISKQGTEILTNHDYVGRIYLPFFKGPVVTFSGVMLIFAALFIVFVTTGASNAVNLTDGLDGLAAGCLIMAGTALAIIAFLSNNIDVAEYLHILYIEQSGEIAIYLSGMVGACIGFLWYNSHPAQVFMGDTGSLGMGAILGVSAVLLKREVLLAFVGGIFVIEALSVILQVASYKLRNKKRVFLCAPLHHHYEYKGLPETKVVIRFWIIAFLLAVIGLSSLKFQ